MLINNIELVNDTMRKLKKVGFRFSLDDFGTGYSSLSYLSKMQNSLPRDSTIQQHAKQMFKDFKISYYVDTETGLPSVNHFVFK